MTVVLACLFHLAFALATTTVQPASLPPEAVADDGWTDVPVEFERPFFFVHLSVGALGPEWFIVDSGAFPTILDRRVADALTLPQRSTKIANVPSIAGVPLAGEGLVFQPHECLVFDIEGPMSEAMGRRVSGVLGADFLATRVVELDYKTGRMRTRAAEGFRAREGDRVVPVWMSDRLWVTVELCPRGGESLGATMMVDTGFSGGIDMPRSLAEGFGLPGAAPTIFSGSRTVKGDSECISLRLASLRLGDQDVPRPVLDLSPPEGQALGSGKMGMLGARILEQFTVTFDLARQRLLLRPNERFGEPGEVSRTGLGLVAKGDNFDHVVVAHVATASPAAVAGLKAGDAVITVDGRAAAEYRLRPLIRYLQDAVGRSVPLHVERDGTGLDLVMRPEQRLD